MFLLVTTPDAGRELKIRGCLKGGLPNLGTHFRANHIGLAAPTKWEVGKVGGHGVLEFFIAQTATGGFRKAHLRRSEALRVDHPIGPHFHSCLPYTHQLSLERRGAIEKDGSCFFRGSMSNHWGYNAFYADANPAPRNAFAP